MNRFQRIHEQILLEDHPVTGAELSALERVLDRMYEKINIDVEFSKHFFDRVNDARNKKQITINELAAIFQKAYQKYKDLFKKEGEDMKMSHGDWQAVLNDITTDINLPFVIQWNERTQEIELVSKTVMRKKNFMTSNRKLRVR